MTSRGAKVPSDFSAGWAGTQWGAPHYWRGQQVTGTVVLTSLCGRSSQFASKLFVVVGARCMICERLALAGVSGVR